MRAVIQRVRHAAVEVDSQIVGQIDGGLLVLLGVTHGDQAADVDYLTDKILGLRIFNDDAGKMNRSVVDVGGGVLVVSQFTLFGDCRKGRRPSFVNAGPPDLANELYEQMLAKMRAKHQPIASGIFAADMKVSLLNDGPVTLIVDSPNSQPAST